MELLPSDAGSEQSVTISLRDYRALMADREALIRLTSVAAGTVCISPRAKFRHDREVVTFLNENATTATVDSLMEEALRRFGPERTPSRSAIGRYVGKVRQRMGVGEQRRRRPG